MSLKTTVQTKLKSKQDFSLSNSVFLYLEDRSEKSRRLSQLQW